MDESCRSGVACRSRQGAQQVRRPVVVNGRRYLQRDVFIGQPLLGSAFDPTSMHLLRSRQRLASISRLVPEARAAGGAEAF